MKLLLIQYLDTNNNNLIIYHCTYYYYKLIKINIMVCPYDYYVLLLKVIILLLFVLLLLLLVLVLSITLTYKQIPLHPAMVLPLARDGTLVAYGHTGEYFTLVLELVPGHLFFPGCPNLDDLARMFSTDRLTWTFFSDQL